MWGMLAVPPLYTSAPDAHAKLGGPLDQKHQKRKTNWLRAVNKLYRMRIASREVDAKVATASVASRGRRLRHSPMADTQRRQVKLVLPITRRGLEARPPFLGGFVEPRANAHARGLTKLCDC